MTHDQQRAKGSLRGDQDTLIFGRGFSFSGYERDPLYLSLDGRRFLDISGCSGLDSVSDGRATVFADFDDDGDTDVFLTTLQAQAQLLFRNNLGPGRFLRVVLEGRGAGRDAFGSVVRAAIPGGVLTRIKSGGSGFVSQHDPRLLFGLGPVASVQALDVSWSDGARERFAGPFAAGVTVRLVQGSGSAEVVTLAARRLPDPPAAGVAATGLRLAPGDPLPDVPLLPVGAASLRELLRPGRRLLVNLWATWCLPCQREMPELERLRPRLEASGVDVVGLSVDTDPDAPVAAFAGRLVSYPVFRVDPAALGRIYATDELTVPVSLLVGPDGRLESALRGWSDATRQALEALVR